MNIIVEKGPPPSMDAYGVGLEQGRMSRRKLKYTAETIAQFLDKVKHKKDDYTRGFVAGFTEKEP